MYEEEIEIRLFVDIWKLFLGFGRILFFKK